MWTITVNYTLNNFKRKKQMIQANELRIGNLLHNNLEQPFKVAQIQGEHGTGENDDYWLLSDELHEIHVLDLHPILLRPKYLRLVGLKIFHDLTIKKSK